MKTMEYIGEIENIETYTAIDKVIKQLQDQKSNGATHIKVYCGGGIAESLIETFKKIEFTDLPQSDLNLITKLDNLSQPDPRTGDGC